MTISKDRVKPSPHPDSWKLREIFMTGVVYGSYLAVMTVVFFWAMRSTDFFSVALSSCSFLMMTIIPGKQMGGGDEPAGLCLSWSLIWNRRRSACGRCAAARTR
jgi:hypothetical protein